MRSLADLPDQGSVACPASAILAGLCGTIHLSQVYVIEVGSDVGQFEVRKRYSQF